MAGVLRGVGMAMEEHLELTQQPSRALPPPFALLLPGLARGCYSAAHMREVLSPCSEGRADTTLLLQFANESKQKASFLNFSECRRILVDAGRQALGCSFVFARQQFWALPSHPCKQSPGRVQMQALSIGRAYEWSRHLLG
ncbi:MAG: hypothetical protein SGPRY_001679 [Prymnesium sp.]